MLFRIAELITEIPDAGDMLSRARDYKVENVSGADIIIRADLYNPTKWENMSPDGNVYMQSGAQFYRQILDFDGLMLHASAVAVDGKAYLFSGPSGMGKSTHTRLWQQIFGEKAVVFNDDKPALRRINGVWYAYGTPWCGKDGINVNLKAPLAGICFLRRGQDNIIRRLDALEASSYVISQTMRRFKDGVMLDKMLTQVDRLVTDIPIYELYNQPVPEAARLSYATMYKGAVEAGL